MRRTLIATIAGLSLLGLAARAGAVPDEYDDTQSHPLRLIAYLVHPVGFATEWLVFRPFHYVVSRPYLEPVFGHRRHGEIRVH